MADPRDKEMIDRLSRKLVEWRMTAPAIFFLESMKPLNFIGSQFMLVFSPFVNILFPSVEEYDRMRKLLEDRDSVEMIIQAIEARENEFSEEDRSPADSTEANAE